MDDILQKFFNKAKRFLLFIKFFEIRNFKKSYNL